MNYDAWGGSWGGAWGGSWGVEPEPGGRTVNARWSNRAVDVDVLWSNYRRGVRWSNAGAAQDVKWSDQ